MDFKKWFIETSHVPSVVYHGSHVLFQSFQIAKKAGVISQVTEQPIFFSEDPKFAEEHARPRGYIYTVRLSCHNTFDPQFLVPEPCPRYWQDPSESTPLGHRLFGDIASNRIWSDGEEDAEGYWVAILRGNWDTLEHPAFIQWLKNNGFDSCTIYEGSRNIYIWDPSLATILGIEPYPS